MKKIIKTIKESGIVQVTTYDERWYVRQEEDLETKLPIFKFVPSSTWISSYWPKGTQFYRWLAEKGWDEAERIRATSGDKGTKVHSACVDLIDGKAVWMDSKYPNQSTGLEEELSVDEYECILSFALWFKKTRPEILGREYVVWNEKENYAGTVDLKCKIDGHIFVVDLKTGQNIWSEQELQLSSYLHADQEAINAKMAILQLGYKRNKQQYKFTEIDDKFHRFLFAKMIWGEENKDAKPHQRDYPMSIKLTEDKT